MALQKLISEKLDMKWIDIKIKELRKQINDQSVVDAKQTINFNIAS